MRDHKHLDEQSLLTEALNAMRASYKFISMVHHDLEKFNLDNQKKPINSIYMLYGRRIQKQLKDAGNLLKSDGGFAKGDSQ